MDDGQALKLFDEIISNKFNQEKLCEMFEQNYTILFECVLQNNDKSNKALAILLENGIKSQIKANKDILFCFKECAIGHRNVDALRIYFQYDFEPNTELFRNFVEVSALFYDHTQREEALKIILNHAKNSPTWVEKMDYFRAIRTAKDVFMLANYGARFQKKLYDLPNSFIKYDPLDGPMIEVTAAELKKHCALVASGLEPCFPEIDPIRQVANGQEDFDEALVVFRKQPFTRIIMQSGYKTTFCRNQAILSEYVKPFWKEIEDFKRMYSRQPLSLQRLAANVIRKELRPNAVVGSRVLAQVQPGKEVPPLYPHLVPQITFGLTEENIEKTLEEKLSN